jgi:hypothetical protein
MKKIFLLFVIFNFSYAKFLEVLRENILSVSSIGAFAAVGYFSHANKYNIDLVKTSKLLSIVASNLGEWVLKENRVLINAGKFFAPFIGYGIASLFEAKNITTQSNSFESCVWFAVGQIVINNAIHLIHENLKKKEPISKEEENFQTVLFSVVILGLGASLSEFVKE